MKNACRRKSVLLLTCCIWLKLGIWIRFLPVWWKKCLINIFQDLALASDQFFRYLSQFFYFLWFARVTGKRYKERSSWRTKYSSIILRAERMEKAREVNKGDRGAALDFWRQTDRVICSARFAASLFFFVFAPGIDVAVSLLFGS